MGRKLRESEDGIFKKNKCSAMVEMVDRPRQERESYGVCQEWYTWSC